MSEAQRGILPSENFSSFPQVLSYRAHIMPNEHAFLFYNEDGNGNEVPVSYADLHMRAICIANQLSKNLSPGERCILLYKPGVEYIAAFFACLYAKIIAVPVFLPNKQLQVEKLEQIITNCLPKAILGTSYYSELIDSFISSTSLDLLCLYSDTFDIAKQKIEIIGECACDLDDIAFLQYSSGSTGNPKGIKITHRNLFSNTEAIYKNFNFNNDSKGIIWLPPYHDMGLIGGVLASIYGGIELVLTPPATFVKNPLSWLNLISTHKGTISGGPNFAYDLCIKQMQRRPNKNLDLSSWKIAFCGAEPIFPDTIHRFIEVFSPYGFDKNAFFPCYGLAESTLMVSCRKSLRPTTKYFSRHKLKLGIIEEVNEASEDFTEIVSCGEVISNHKVCIVDQKTRNLKSTEIGEIWIQGASVTKGYWENHEENLNLFAVIRSDEPRDDLWLRTGDLGFISGNELFISGRTKDLLIVNGLNYYPQDIEKEVERAHPTIISAVAFSIIEDDTEKLTIVIEIKKSDVVDSGDSIEILIRRAILDKYNLFIQNILFVETKSIPRTTSGKKQRYLSKELYLNGKFKIISFSHEDIRDPLEGGDSEAIHELIASFLGIEKKQLTVCNSLRDYGLDSIKMMELKYKLEDHFNVCIDSTDFLTKCSVANLVEMIKFAPKTPKQEFTFAHPDTMRIPVNPLQQALWLTYMVEPYSLSYNVSRSFIVEKLNVTYLFQALEQVITEQISLRSTFCTIDGKIYQKIHEKMLPGTFNFQENEQIEENDFREKARFLSGKCFVLENGPLFNVHIFKLHSDKYFLIFCAHHIIVDFWSINIFVKRIAQLYTNISNKNLNSSPSYNSLKIGWEYSDFYENYITSAQYLDDLNFWQQQYATVAHKKIQTVDILKTKDSFKLYEFSFTQQQSEDFRNFCTQNHISGFNFSLFIFSILLGILNRTNDVSIGLPLAIRESTHYSDYIGYCVNLLPIRIKLDKFENLYLLIDELKNLVSLIFRHKHFPFTHLMEKIKFPRRADNKLPIVDAVFLYQSSQYTDETLALCAINSNKGQFNLGDAIFKMQPFPSHENQIDLTLNATLLSNSVKFVIEYSTAVYNEEHIKNFAEAYSEILNYFIYSGVINLSSILEDGELIELLSMLYANENIKDHEFVHNCFETEHNEVSEKLITIWREVLQNQHVKLEDNFFALGGSSLLAVKLASKIDQIFEVKIDIRNIFRYQSVKELANHISTLPKEHAPSSIKVIKRVQYNHETENNL